VKTLIFILVLSGASIASFSQSQADSLQRDLTEIVDKVNLDSLPRTPQLPDSLLGSYKKVDSIRTDFNQKASALKSEYDSSMMKIEDQRDRLTSQIDSLQKLNLPIGKQTNKLDSLNQAQAATTTKFNSKIEDLKSKTTGKLNALDLPPQYKEPVQALTKNIDGVNLAGADIKVPGVEIPGYTMPKIDGLGDVDIGKLGNVAELGGLPKIETPVGDLGQVGQQLQGVQEDIKNVAGGDLNDAKNIPKVIENQASNIEGVAELQKQSGVVSDYQTKLENMNDPEAAKKQAAEMAQKAAVDHFAGKQEQLKAAMDQMSKYKQKYSSVSSIKDLPKRKPNAMKGKPFVERLIPGLYFQYQQKIFNLFDLNPYLGYRISGRFTAGAGWNHRFSYNRKFHEWSKKGRIYGPRAYVDFKLGKGFIAHLESEVMNTFVPSVIGGTVVDQGQREWVWGMMTGLKKDYKIYKNLKGTVLIQYNIFNPKYKSPYVDRLNSRIGFEYTLKKRKAVRK
jgi:hypothetical protein